MTKTYPLVPLSSALTHYTSYIDAPEPKLYPKLSVKLYGKGVILDAPADGSLLKMKRHQIARGGQVILSEIWGKKGAIGFVPDEGEGALCTSHFFLFDVQTDRVAPKYLQALFTANYLEEQLNADAKGTTGYAAVRPKYLLGAKIPLPSLDEQHRVVSRIEEFSSKVRQVTRLHEETKTDQARMLLAAYGKAIQGAEWLPMEDVVPLVRRAVQVEPLGEYHELGIRSFGKGTFHKPSVTGATLGSKRLFRIEPGDLLFNIVFAWEGAVAVAQPNDVGRVGSHRFLTCVPKDGQVLTSFIAFHFLTDRGLEDLGIASPGGAGRNRTLGIESLAKIKVPVPAPEKQRWFGSLLEKAEGANRLRTEVAIELDALMPSILSKAFRGNL